MPITFPSSSLRTPVLFRSPCIQLSLQTMHTAPIIVIGALIVVTGIAALAR